ncbi:MAG: multidrug effflux MFS transporter [Rhizobiaceae bacterium]
MDAIKARQTDPKDAGLPGSRAEFIAMIASLMAINAIAIDIMLPALPDMGAALGVANENSRQYVLTSYFLGFGFAQLAFGPLADRFGRKLPLQIGMAIYVIAAVAAIMVSDFNMLLAARFVQGVGAASTRVLSVAIVRDIFGGRRMAEIMSLVMMVFMVAPVVAPAAGQVIILFADWHMIFLFMAVTCAAIMLWVSLRLPETLPVERRTPLVPGEVAAAFLTVFTNRMSLCYALATMFIFGSLFGFIAAAQQIYVGIYGLSVWFPLAFALIAGVMATSSYINSRLVWRLGMRRLSHGALIGYALATLSWWLLSLSAGPLPFWLFMTLLSLIFFFFGWIGANFNAMAMEPLGAIAGTGSAVLGFLQTAGGSLVGALIGQSFDGTVTPVAFGFLIVSLAAIGLVLFAERGRLFKAHNDPV